MSPDPARTKKNERIFWLVSVGCWLAATGAVFTGLLGHHPVLMKFGLVVQIIAILPLTIRGIYRTLQWQRAIWQKRTF